MFKVSYDEVKRVQEFIDKINKINLKDIEWIKDDGEVIKFNKKLINYWKFIGLSNNCFAQEILSKVVNGEEKEILEEFEGIVDDC